MLLGDVLANKAHSVALMRQLLLTIKTTFLKTLQDYFRLENCLNCDVGPANSVRQDLTALLGFFEFVYEKNPLSRTGLGEFGDINTKNILKAYTNFVIAESKVGSLLSTSLDDYLNKTELM